MYIPDLNREDDIQTLVAFMRAHSFATLVSYVDNTLIASHIPLLVSAREEQVMLMGHVAKPNPHWRGFDIAESLAIFTGPHAYISPSLYEKRESVPTWNYIAVHAYGIPRAISTADSPAAVAAMLEATIDVYDPTYRRQWDELSEKFRSGMMNGIVCFQMEVTRLEGKYKLSQNRSLTDQENVAQSLLQSQDQEIHATGAAMLHRLSGRQ
jgi:transcriptional regulator